MATITSPSNTTATEHKFSTTKYRKIEILMLNNYPAFKNTCKSALQAAGWWTIITGTNVQPIVLGSKAQDKWGEKAGRAQGLIHASVSNTIRKTLLATLGD